ncbi:MAG: hypothetical protein E6G10_05005 [Actinobacteria bacterium]|nr:MAG: hypothetical protein E6G10_05005 [Actinomycetota bacterium]
MSGRGRAAWIAALAAGVALFAPAAAFGHAALLRTSPQASVTVNGSPARVSLTYSDVIEPKFAIVSVTDAAGHSQVAGNPTRSKANLHEIDVPVRHLDRGWYLVFWRVISADGHPVRGAFTFAVGPNAGPAPQFVVPSLRETAATPSLLIARWVMFLSLMAAVGLLAFRVVVARPILHRVPESSLRAVSVALAVAFGVALVAVPVYVDLATAQFTLRSAFDVSALVPLMRSSSFGRSLLDLEVVLALAAVAAAIAVRLDRPELRSIAALLALIGAGGALAAALVVPGLAGHAADYSPRGVSLGLDWLHLAGGGLWIGGLIGLVTLGATAGARRVACMVVVVPRFSRVALGSVLVLVASGTVVSFIRLPTLSSLFDTGYGQALVVKIGILGRRQPAAHDAAPRGLAQPARARGEHGLDAAATGGRRGRPGGRRDLRRRPALQPRAAAQGARRHRPGGGDGRTRPGDADVDARRLPDRRADRAEPCGRAQRVLGQGRAQRAAGQERRRHRQVHDARHGDDAAGLPPRPAAACDLRQEVRALAGHGRPVGRELLDRAARAAAVRRPAPRPRPGVKPMHPTLTLVLAAIALLAGAAAIVVVALLTHQVLR